VKNTLRVFLLFILTFSYLNAGEFKHSVIIKLKKDEHKKILVKYDIYQKLFKFRWTLFTDNNLIVFQSYDRIVSQKVLSTSYRRQSYTVELKTRGASYYAVPYILIKFKEYDYGTGEVTFELFLSDDRNEIDLKYLENS